MGKKKVAKKSEKEVIKEGRRTKKALHQQKKEITSHNVSRGCVYIHCSYNNTIITLTDTKGNTLATKSAGSIGFRGTKQATGYAASKVAELIASLIKEARIKEIEVVIKGLGSGRESALRALSAKGINISEIRDKTAIPHGGCRPPKPRRV